MSHLDTLDFRLPWTVLGLQCWVQTIMNGITLHQGQLLLFGGLTLAWVVSLHVIMWLQWSRVMGEL